MTVVPATTSSPHGSAAARVSPLAVGVVVWLASELMFFGGLFAAYFTLRSSNKVWPPADVDLDTARAVLATVVLLSSSATMHFAVKAADHGDRSGALRWLYATFLLGTAFVLNLASEWAGNGFSISSHAYGSIYYLLTGFHGLHLVGGLVLMIISAVVVSGTDPKVSLGPTFTISAYYWHFVDLVWIFVFFTVFVVR